MIVGYNIPTQVGFLAIFKKDDSYIIDTISSILLDLQMESVDVYYNTASKQLFDKNKFVFSHIENIVVTEMLEKLQSKEINEKEIVLNSYGITTIFAMNKKE
jgi:formylmethanofuran dehydrogenase subunit E-like metal-binding protein